MRHKTLYYSFLLAYVLVFICSFLFINLWTSNRNKNTLLKSEAGNLYNSLQVITDELVSPSMYDLTEQNENSKSLIQTLNIACKSLNSTIQIINVNGKLIYSSEPSTDFPSRFNYNDFKNNRYKFNTFYGTYEKNILNIALPVYSSSQQSGYIVLHKDLKSLNDLHLDIDNSVYITFLIEFLLTSTILIVFTATVFIPLKKLSIAAREYAKGNFTYDGLSDFNSDNEIGRLGLSLKFMASELNTKETDEKNFIANVSHDFRSPLTSIKGYVEAVKDGTIPYEMQDKYLNIILFETDRLTKLTENLLTLNTTGSTVSRLDYSTFTIYNLVMDNLESLEGKCAKKHINFLVKDNNCKKTKVVADKAKISQVFYNLVDNAIKFSKNNSTITISLSTKGEKVFVSVKDYGIGIPKDSQNKIWDRFYKTDLSRGKDKSGSGLGLAIAKQIIKSHNENINVISTEGVGTEFIFTLKKA